MLMKSLCRVERWLTAVALAVTVPTMVAITAVVLIAILYRYVLNAAIVSSFDLTTLLFCWMVFIGLVVGERDRSEEHTSELQSLMRISYAVFCLTKKKTA